MASEITVAELLNIALAGALGGAPYPGLAPDNAAPPYMVLGGVIHTPNNTLRGTANLKRSRVQIDCYDKTYLGAEAVATGAEQIMGGATLYGSPTLFRSVQLSHEYMGEDPDVKLHRVMLEFAVWHKP